MKIDQLLAMTVKCRYCGHRWVPRIPNPIECPKCRKRHPLKEAK